LNVVNIYGLDRHASISGLKSSWAGIPTRCSLVALGHARSFTSVPPKLETAWLWHHSSDLGL